MDELDKRIVQCIGDTGRAATKVAYLLQEPLPIINKRLSALVRKGVLTNSMAGCTKFWAAAKKRKK